MTHPIVRGDMFPWNWISLMDTEALPDGSTRFPPWTNYVFSNDGHADGNCQMVIPIRKPNLFRCNHKLFEDILGHLISTKPPLDGKGILPYYHSGFRIHHQTLPQIEILWKLAAPYSPFALLIFWFKSPSSWCVKFPLKKNMLRICLLLWLLPVSSGVRSKVSGNETLDQISGACEIYRNCCATAKCSKKTWFRPKTGLYARYETWR